MCTSSDTECKVWVTLFNRLSNQLFPTFICGRYVVVLQVSCHLCQFERRLNHFLFVNILCSFIVMIPLCLRERALRLLHIQVVAVCIFVI